MQVIIDEIVSRIQTLDSGTLLSPDTLRQVVAAVRDAMAIEEQQRKNVAEELSLQNYQQRNRPWMG
jgi:hypothetical protein